MVHGMLLWHLLENCVSVTTVTLVLSLVILTLSPRIPAKQHGVYCVSCTENTRLLKLSAYTRSGQLVYSKAWPLTTFHATALPKGL